MTTEHEAALKSGVTLKSSNAILMVFKDGKGYFNCRMPDCDLCEDFFDTWEDAVGYYDIYGEEEWKQEDLKD